MSSLFLSKEGFETKSLTEEQRREIFENFMEMVHLALNNKDKFFYDDSFLTHTFSYGEFFQTFNLPWKELKEKESLKGIPQKLLQFLCGSLGFPFKLESTTTAYNNANEHKGHTGLELPAINLTPYVCHKESWHNWKAPFFRENQNEIDWSNSIGFWPDVSNAIREIKLELECHGKNIPHFDTEKIGTPKFLEGLKCLENTFHDIITHKSSGSEKEGYIESIGRRICESNYYVYDAELSSTERRQANSLRRIFKIINKGKKLQYLSLDFEKGTLELCNHKGKHLGEFRFLGTPNSAADDSGNHDLKSIQ